ncbi:CBS domain-containing protein [Streptomyces prasinopilosus]|uniref:CBS domain-containing protein n=1 Tax=Streptomyces prasinopilosus TaxID=67344 RepID=A0A1G6QUQ9_9ACTN|nr:CBS domain-containing protein [Streptomyces prasinopilosus]SDC96041.1 CBS domain-containing protein [Streptomyces prasinopilosus]
MTLIQTHSRPTGTDAVSRTATEAMDAAGPQVWDDMTVEVALSVMAAARTGHLVVCDEDGRCSGLVTRERLTAVREGGGYTDRVRLRDISDGSALFASPLTPVAEAEQVMRHRRLGVLPVVDDRGNALGVLTLSR